MKFQFDRFVLATLLRGLPGMAGIVASVDGWVLGGGLCLVLAVWADAVVGWVARKGSWQKTASVIEVETLLDFLCFVWAPVQFLLAQTRHPAILVGIVVFVAAGIFRLARFKIEGLVRGSYRGLPVTYNGYIFPLAAVLNQQVSGYSTVIFLLVLIGVSALMVSARLVVPEVG